MSNKFRRLSCLFLVVAMLLGLAPEPVRAQVTPSYNPYQGVGGDPRYGGQYGQRYDPSYYQPGNVGYSGGHGFTRLIPPLIGGVMGAIIGAKFGFLGVAIGGALGFFGGKAISSMVFGDSYHSGSQSYYFTASNRANFIPGAIGAMLGAFMGSSFGVVGMLIGGGIGYLVAKGVARMMFPNLYYGGSYTPQPGYGGGYGGGYGYGGIGSPYAPETAPSAPTTSDLGVLKARVDAALQTYHETMEGGTDQDAILKARLAYLSAQRNFLQARSDAR